MGHRKPTSALITLGELDCALDSAVAPRIDTTSLTQGLSEAEVCELATETTGDTAQTVQALIEGVILKHGGKLNRSALAALNAVAYYHVPNLQDRYDALMGMPDAD